MRLILLHPNKINPPPATAEEEEATSLDFSSFPAPELNDLMRRVSDPLKCKWQDIAGGLGVGNLNNIHSAHGKAVDPDGDCMRDVFGKWKSQRTSEYSWKKIAEVLSLLKENDLLVKLHEFLSKKYPSQPPRTDD